MTARLAIAAGATLADLAALRMRSGAVALSPPQAIVMAEQIGGGASWRLMHHGEVIGIGGFYPLGEHLAAWMIAGASMSALLVDIVRRMRWHIRDHAAVAGKAIRCEVLRTNTEGRRLARLLGFQPVTMSATGMLTLEWRP